MDILQRINSVLNYKLELDLNKRINRNKSLTVIFLVFILLNVGAYYLGTRWFGIERKSYYEKEISELNQVLELNPGSKDVQAQIAMSNYLSGEQEKAIKLLRDILAKAPDNNIARLELGVILSEQKQYDEAIKLLAGYVKNNQGLEARIAYLYLGRDYLAKNNYSAALNHLKNAAERDPGNPVVFYYLGQAYEKMNNRKYAIQSYEKALEINNGYIEADKALLSLLKRTQEEKHKLQQ